MPGTALAKIETRLSSLDLTHVIRYSKKIEDISKGFNTMLAPMYLRDFIMAYDITNTLLSQSIRADLEAAAALKTSESIAYLDNAGPYLSARDIKDTAEARKRYVAVDSDVQHAMQLKAKTEAMVAFLRNKLMEFRLAHDDVKKIAYSNDYNNNSPHEGM